MSRIAALGGISRPLFTPEQYRELKQQQRKLHDLLSEFDKAEACGIECTEMRAVAAHIDDMLASVERHYMSPPPA